MSQMTPETPPRRRDNAFTRKIGPLPMWAWLAIVATAIIIWGVYQARKNATTSSTTSSSQVPDFILQDYQQTGPPGPPGPAGKPGTDNDKDTDKDTGKGGRGKKPRTGIPGKGGPIYGGHVVAGAPPDRDSSPPASGTVRNPPVIPHPGRRPAPRHHAPRHPARS